MECKSEGKRERNFEGEGEGNMEGRVRGILMARWRRWRGRGRGIWNGKKELNLEGKEEEEGGEEIGFKMQLYMDGELEGKRERNIERNR